MAKVDAENSSYGAFERFLIWFFIPLVFTSVLLGVLLSIFDYNVMNNLLKMASKIPIVNHIVPAPKEGAATDKTSGSEQPADKQKALEDEVARLNQKIADQEAELKQAAELNQQKDQNIQDLKAQISTLQDQLKGKTQSEEEYSKQIQQLATTYASMTPSKAGPLLENLTLNERVLVLSAMKTDDRVKILEKMDPKIAAETSILLKDTVPVRDTEIAALQERLQLNEPLDSKKAEKLSRDDMATTFANMAPKSAATVLVEMMKSSQDKVVAILSSMDNQARSRILTAMADVSKEATATLTAKLGQ